MRMKECKKLQPSRMHSHRSEQKQVEAEVEEVLINRYSSNCNKVSVQIDYEGEGLYTGYQISAVKCDGCGGLAVS